jgi:hypothetical protein
MLTPEQKRLRLGLITSSNAAAALGRDPNTSPRRAKSRILGQEVDITLEAMQRGNLLEQPTIDFVADALRMEAIEAPFIAHKDGWSGDSTDALLADPATGEVKALVEAKTVGLGGRDAWGKEMTDEVPPKVLIQCHWHLIHHPDIALCYVPVLFGGYFFRFALYVVGRSQAFADKIYADAGAWHAKYIKNDEQVPCTGLDDDTSMLKSCYPFDNDEALSAPEGLDQWVKHYTQCKKRRDDANKAYEEVRNHLRDTLKDAASMHGDGFTITYKNSKESTKIDWQAVATELGAPAEIVHKHTVCRQGPRVLRVSHKEVSE